MKITLSCLKSFLEIDEQYTTFQIAEKITSIGLEVEDITDLAANLKGFIVAEIIDCEKHPNADKLQVCKVNNGSEVLQIVCGAHNARKGIKAILAPVGIIIPNGGFAIKKSNIRGIESNGMLCSASELQLSEESEGIVELPDNYQIGSPFAKEANLEDTVIEIKLTPNRGDCASVYGVARDLAASGFGILKPIEVPNIVGNYQSKINIKRECDEDKCSLFAGIYIKGACNTKSPVWLESFLSKIDQKSKSAIVDIVNYVMLAFGRPMHAYDANKIKGDIIIRNVKNGEKFSSLSGLQYDLNEGMIVIADSTKPIALAGIIGGDNSSTELDTTDIFIESAVFDAINIADTSRRLNILSDAKFRFERGVDDRNVTDILKIAAKMIMDICGGEASEIVTVGEMVPLRKLSFRISTIERITGLNIETAIIEHILQELGFKVEQQSRDNFILTIPSYRHDISIEEDIVEEIVRIYGYDKITELAPSNFVKNITKIDDDLFYKIRKYLANCNLSEVITYSFMNKEKAAIFTPINTELEVQNPISIEMNYMRPLILPNLLDIVKNNINYGVDNTHIFEIGRIFKGTTPDAQPQVLSGVRVGAMQVDDHYHEAREADIFDVKSDLFNVLNEFFGLDEEKLIIESATQSYFHPKRSFVVKLAKDPIGYFGEVHPFILEKYDIQERVNVFSVLFNNIPESLSAKRKINNGKFISHELQSVIREFAFIVDDKIKARDIIKIVNSADRKLITQVKIMDVYRHERIGLEKKSVAFAVTLQPQDKTLTTEEIDLLSNKIIDGIANNLNGVLRDANLNLKLSKDIS